MRLRAILLLVVAFAACAPDQHALRGGDNEHAWNYSPRAEISAPDRALYVCCPRNGGDLRIDAVVDGQGRAHDIAITRPPATLGLTVGAACYAFRTVLFFADVTGESDLASDRKDVVTQCTEAERRMGGSFLPPAVPGTTRTCVERMSTVWSLKDYAARPISIPWQCRP